MLFVSKPNKPKILIELWNNLAHYLEKYINMKTGKKLLLIICLYNSTILAQPNLEWANYNSGERYSDNFPTSITNDKNGYLYTTGVFIDRVDFDPGVGVENITSYSSSWDVFIQKLDKDGNYIWTKRIGNSNWEYVYDIKSDDNSNIYIAGYFYGTVDFDPGAGSYTVGTKGALNTFLLKLDSFGNFKWVKTFKNIDNSGRNQPKSLTLDKSNNIYLAGYFKDSINFNPTGSPILSYSNRYRPYIAKFDSSGNLKWTKQLVNTLDTYIEDIEFSRTGFLYLVGPYSGTVDFDPDSTNYFDSAGYSNDGFILKLDTNGKFVDLKSLRTDGWQPYCEPNSIHLDKYDNIIVGGRYKDSADFDPGLSSLIHRENGGGDNFITKLDSNGALIWSKSFGGKHLDIIRHIFSDYMGNIYSTGQFEDSCDFDPSSNDYILPGWGIYQSFIQKLDKNGNFLWAESFGTNGAEEIPSGLSIDTSIVLTGYFQTGIDADPNPSSYHFLGTSNGESRCTFTIKFNETLNNSSIEKIYGVLDPLTIYPNPTNGSFNLNVPQVYVNSILKIIDKTGRIVFKDIVNSKNQIVKLNHLKSGIYNIFIIPESGKILSNRFIKN